MEKEIQGIEKYQRVDYLLSKQQGFRNLKLYLQILRQHFTSIKIFREMKILCFQ